MKEKSLTIVKFYEAPVSKVFQAWGNNEAIKKWFISKPDQTVPICEVDFRVGGKYKIGFLSDVKTSSGIPFVVSGEYQEIVPNKKILFTWSYGNDSKEKITSYVTLDFQEKNGGTELTLTHEKLENDQSVQNHTQGWNGCLESLAKYLIS